MLYTHTHTHTDKHVCNKTKQDYGEKTSGGGGDQKREKKRKPENEKNKPCTLNLHAKVTRHENIKQKKTM